MSLASSTYYPDSLLYRHMAGYRRYPLDGQKPVHYNQDDVEQPEKPDITMSYIGIALIVIVAAAIAAFISTK